MKTLNDLKKTIVEEGIESYQINKVVNFEDTFQVTLTAKEIFSIPIGYNIKSFTIAGRSISFSVKF